MSFPIIISTYHKMEKFIEPSLSLMEETWQDHGKIYIISDNKKTQTFKNVIETYRYDHSLSWLAGLYNGLFYLKNKFPELDVIYLMLEDLVPLRQIDINKLKNIEETFNELNWDYLYFPHYENKYHFNVQYKGEKFAETPSDFPFYSQIGVNLYKINYLINLCEQAIDNNLKSPWQFEKLKSRSKHYVSSYNWTSVRDGYSKNRFINKDALDFIENDENPLKKLLTKNYSNQKIYFVYQTFIVQKFKNLLYRLKNKQLIFILCI